MTLELDFGRLALLTIWADYEQPLRPFFKGFVVKKKRIKHCSVCTKRMHKMKLKNIFSFLKKLLSCIIFLFLFLMCQETFSIVFCSNRDTSPWDLSIMTLIRPNGLWMTAAA